MINTIEQLKAIIPTVAGAKIDNYVPYLTQADQWVCSMVLGPVSAHLGEHTLQQLVDRATAFRAYQTAIPGLDVTNTSNGFVVVNDDKYLPASRDRVRALVDSMEQSLQRTLVEIYELIEDTPDLATIYKPFAHGSIVERSFLPTMREFDRYRKFNGTYAQWIDNKPRHLEVRLMGFDPRFGSALIDRVLDDPTCEKNKAIIAPLRMAFAAMVMDDAPMWRTLFDRVERELRANPALYPEYTPVASTPFESKSVLSTI